MKSSDDQCLVNPFIYADHISQLQLDLQELESEQNQKCDNVQCLVNRFIYGNYIDDKMEYDKLPIWEPNESFVTNLNAFQSRDLVVSKNKLMTELHQFAKEIVQKNKIALIKPSKANIKLMRGFIGYRKMVTKVFLLMQAASFGLLSLFHIQTDPMITIGMHVLLNGFELASFLSRVILEKIERQFSVNVGSTSPEELKRQLSQYTINFETASFGDFNVWDIMKDTWFQPKSTTTANGRKTEKQEIIIDRVYTIFDDPKISSNTAKAVAAAQLLYASKNRRTDLVLNIADGVLGIANSLIPGKFNLNFLRQGKGTLLLAGSTAALLKITARADPDPASLANVIVVISVNLWEFYAKLKASAAAFDDDDYFLSDGDDDEYHSA